MTAAEWALLVAIGAHAGAMVAAIVKLVPWASMENSGAYRFLTHEGTPIMYRENVVEPAVRPDGQPLYPFFKAV